MQVTETFLGLSATGWTAIGSIVSAASIICFLIYNSLYLGVSLSGLRVQFEGVKLQLAGVLYSGCPVLILRSGKEGESSIFNCGQGPALMVQWGYGSSIPEAKVMHRLGDNIIPAGEARPIDLNEEFARVYGVILFAYGVTNDKFVTSISWPAGEVERRVHFGTYNGEMPHDL